MRARVSYSIPLTKISCKHLGWFSGVAGENNLDFVLSFVAFGISNISYCAIFRKQQLKTVVEKVLNCHFDENELLMVLKSLIGREIFWQTFGRFGPFPVGVTHRSSGGQNFKMRQMTFHVYQITREVIRITKIYSLLCVGCMVREILTKCHPKVKWGQIFNNIQFAWMIYQIIPLSLHIPKIGLYTFKLFVELSLLK